MYGSPIEKPSSARGAGQHVLILADDPGLAELLATTLELAGYRVVVASTAAEALDRLDTHRFDLLVVDTALPALPALPIPSLVICELLGVPYDDHAFFQDHAKTMVHRDATTEQRGAATREIAAFLAALIGKRLADPRDDLLSSLAGRIAAGEIDRGQATEMALLLLFAGHETTANMIALGTLALLRNPGQLARLRDGDDPRLVASAVEELLRYLHITHLGRRRAVLADIEIGGQLIRAGDGVIMVNEAANRDPEVFPDPDRLDLARDARRHVAFGFGVHQCLGQPLARMELQVVYGTLYRRVPTLRLAGSFDDVRFKHDAFIYGVHALPVTW